MECLDRLLIFGGRRFEHVKGVKTKFESRKTAICSRTRVFKPFRRELMPRPRRRRATLASMIGNVGDTIVIESERVDAPGRRGVIEEVLQEQPPRYQVRWEDGHTSTLAPSAGAARIEQKVAR
jgi:uncharacterized protein DUF1918